jgi:hypothetical protein
MLHLRKSVIILIGSFVASLIITGFLLAYLFRTETLDNPALGIIRQKYRWGFAYEELADTNRDGATDFRAVFDGTSRSFGTHDQPREFWEDRNYDGIFEIHATYGREKLERVELDRDNDGQYDDVLTGSEAEDFFESFLHAQNGRASVDEDQ